MFINFPDLSTTGTCLNLSFDICLNQITISSSLSATLTGLVMISFSLVVLGFIELNKSFFIRSLSVTIPFTFCCLSVITTEPKLSFVIAFTAFMTLSFSSKVTGGFLLLNSGLSEIFIQFSLVVN